MMRKVPRLTSVSRARKIRSGASQNPCSPSRPRKSMAALPPRYLPISRRSPAIRARSPITTFM
jgi:hypothetical protein